MALAEAKEKERLRIELESEESRKAHDTSKIRYQNYRKKIMSLVNTKTNKSTIERITKLVLLEDIVENTIGYSYLYTSGYNLSKICSEVLEEDVSTMDVDKALVAIGFQIKDDSGVYSVTSDAEIFTNGTRFYGKPNFHVVHTCLAICEHLLVE
jgi:hypothetical protein